MSYYHKKGGLFEKFFDKRNQFIDEFSQGKISKKELLEKNYDLVRRTNTRPFLRVDSFEMGMFNYQYYNVLAKYYKSLAKEVVYKKKNDRKRQADYLNKVNNYYNEKDKATLAILEHINFEGIDAYYIELNSNSLTEENLYEIVLVNYEKAIFHSKSKLIKNKLKEKGLFKEEYRKSKIDSYINQSY